MPELPEVETIIRGLQKQIVDKKIVVVRVILSKIIRNSAVDFITMIKSVSRSCGEQEKKIKRGYNAKNI